MLSLKKPHQLALLPLLLPCSVWAASTAPCLRYSDTVELRGKLSRHTYPEQPNYKSIAKGDAPATYFFVSPAKPVCVAQGADADADEPAVERVEVLQLMLANGHEAYDALRPHLGKQVLCKGKLFPQQTGHHHTKVLLDQPTCTASR